MEFKKRTLAQIAVMICGNPQEGEGFFVYRSRSYLTEFFQDCDTDYEHDGTGRARWVVKKMPQPPKLPDAAWINPPEKKDAA